MLYSRAVQQAAPGSDVVLSLHSCGPQRHNRQSCFPHVYELEWKTTFKCLIFIYAKNMQPAVIIGTSLCNDS